MTRSGTGSRGPRQHIVDTYTWVEHHCATLDSRGRNTEKWVLEQQIFYSAPCRDYRTVLDDMTFAYGNEAQRWKRDVDEARRVATQRERREKARIIEEELKRIEGRIRHRREKEKERAAAARSRTSAELKERARIERAKADQLIQDAWRRYEKGWADLVKETTVTFSMIPWPLVSTAISLDMITPADTEFLLLSPLHSEGQAAKERIKRALLRWHPDRFCRILAKVKSTDRAAVEAGALAVAKCLNDLLNGTRDGRPGVA
ncbi:hypothetical protein B0H17DRAFT_922784 [Mycena rosella]|uniref:Uncharacterized protein n=1 Tax=Mycena rosella TaxID=1033263 RepID=A0AAD7GRD8_MYCRO|nr:hypothetical protein B0H17DRAFT_922784 [Mycena rosella]